METDTPSTDFESLIGEIVVLDLNSPFVFLGRLVAQHAEYLVLKDVDAHDLRDTATNREKYVRDSRLHGISPNRKLAWVNRREVVAVSKLADVLID